MNDLPQCAMHLAQVRTHDGVTAWQSHTSFGTKTFQFRADCCIFFRLFSYGSHSNGQKSQTSICRLTNRSSHLLFTLRSSRWSLSRTADVSSSVYSSVRTPVLEVTGFALCTLIWSAHRLHNPLDRCQSGHCIDSTVHANRAARLCWSQHRVIRLSTARPQ